MFSLAVLPDILGAEGAELVVGNGEDDAVVGVYGRLGYRGDAVFVLGLLDADPGVVDVDGDVVVGQFADDVDDTGITQIRAVFLKGQAHHQYPSAVHMDASLEHGLDQLRHHVGTHAIVETAASQNDLRVIADALRFMRQIVRIDTYAMAANQPRPERQEIPLSSGCL